MCFSSRSLSVSHRLTANGKFASAGPTRRFAPPVPPRAVLTVHARGTHGREEEEDVAREGEMAAENKPEGKKKYNGINFTSMTAAC
ncbi:hypothetical protein GBF38_014943, partial [Nibea albiflora]